jgi:long-chain fatty acid transport protein
VTLCVRTAATSAWLCAWSVVGALSFASGDARASPPFELFGGVGGQGGFNGRTVPGGASSSYYNPALLVDAAAGVSAGVFGAGEQIDVTLAGRPGAQYAVPVGIENATHANGSQWASAPIPTTWLQNGRPATALSPALPARPRQGDGSGSGVFAYQMLGLVTKLFHDRLALGAYALIPYSKFTGADAFYSDEREQYFTNSLHPELYGDRLVATSIAFAGGIKISDALSVGLGFTLNLTTEAFTPTYVANTGQLQNILVDSDVKVVAGLSPHAGVSYKPAPRLRLTATAHAPEKLAINTDFTFLLANGVQQAASVDFTHDYMPWQFGAGASYDVLRGDGDTFTIAATAVFGLWSTYIDRHSEAPLPGYGWSDTVTPVLGARYQHGPVGLLLDTEYQPTPVPLQTGRTNYVDNDRVGVDGGVDYEFSLLDTAFHVGAQIEAQRLIPRYQSKLPTPTSADGQNHTPTLVADEVPDDGVVNGQPIAGSQGLQTNNPGWPGFGSDGWIVGGGVYLSVAP